jgi:acetyltransferase-like isoleucine patch superfamily enzyme
LPGRKQYRPLQLAQAATGPLGRGVRSDQRPLWLKQLVEGYSRLWAERYLHPAFDALGEGLVAINPKHIEVNGRDVRVGRHVHMMATADNPIRLSSYPQKDGDGSIRIGDYCIVLPGVTITSAVSIEIGNNCMFAMGCYVSDADWHDVYDRTSAPGRTGAVRLGDNVWLGHGTIVCKGVSIGDNSVIGAGSVVTRDIPANCIAAGNPARVIKPLDAERKLVKRESLFTGDVPYAEYIRNFDRWVLNPNTFGRWLRSRLLPTREH